MEPAHPVHRLFIASLKGDINTIKKLLSTEFYFEHELIPAIVIAVENAHLSCIEQLVVYCKAKFNQLPSRLEPEINWALAIGSRKNVLLESIWSHLVTM